MADQPHLDRTLGIPPPRDLRMSRPRSADLRDESLEALESLRDDLAKVSAPHFWEIVDRGGNFDYLPENERALRGEFFSWLKPDHDPATQTPP